MAPKARALLDRSRSERDLVARHDAPSSSSRSRSERLRGSLGQVFASDQALLNLQLHDVPDEAEDSTPTLNMTRVWQERLSRDTPYGSVIKQLWLLDNSGKDTIPLFFLNPMGVLSFMAQEVPWFWDVLVAVANENENTLSIILYQDGATAGNLLHWEPAKATELFYLSFEELGAERLARTNFWIPFCSIRTKQARRVRLECLRLGLNLLSVSAYLIWAPRKAPESGSASSHLRASKVRGGLSHVTEMLLLELKCMSNSVLVQGPLPENKLQVWVRFGFFLSDESAQNGIFRFKGQHEKCICKYHDNNLMKKKTRLEAEYNKVLGQGPLAASPASNATMSCLLGAGGKRVTQSL